MGINFVNKTLSEDRISCGESFEITLSLNASPDITENPVDIVLMLDRSESMAGSPLANLKNGAEKFIEIISTATGGGAELQGGTRIGIVSFASSARADTTLITNVAELESAVNAIDAGGYTNHRAAFETALDLFDPNSSNQKAAVLFTDGFTTAGGNADSAAAALRNAGVSVYVIGLTGDSGIDESALNRWASKPSSAYVEITPDDEELENLFEDLAKNISRTGATEIVVTDRVSPCFRVISVMSPTAGTASIVDANTVMWNISELGVTENETAELQFTVLHTGDCSGSVSPNESVDYSDAQGNVVTFPVPLIEVDCGGTVIVDGCPEPTEVTVNGCEDSVEIDAGEIELSSVGRIVKLDVVLRSVCPGKRVALAVILTEVGEGGSETNRGVKMLTVPAQAGDVCRDITIRCINFVIPDDLTPDVPACTERTYRARIIANYIDSDFVCCENT